MDQRLPDEPYFRLSMRGSDESHPVNRRKLSAEVEKAERENKVARADAAVQVPSNTLSRIQELDEGQAVATVIRRLESSELKITQADIDLVMDSTEIKTR